MKYRTFVSCFQPQSSITEWIFTPGSGPLKALPLVVRRWTSTPARARCSQRNNACPLSGALMGGKVLEIIRRRRFIQCDRSCAAKYCVFLKGTGLRRSPYSAQTAAAPIISGDFDVRVKQSPAFKALRWMDSAVAPYRFRRCEQCDCVHSSRICLPRTLPGSDNVL